MAFGLAAMSVAAPRPKADAPLKIDDPSTLFVSPLSIETLKEPRWITHRVRPRESVAAIAARYAVTAEDIRKWNHLDPKEEAAKRRKTVRVLAHRVPPPPIRVAYVVKAGERWDDVAAKLRVSSRLLRATHYRMKKPLTGKTIVAWVDPIEGPAFDPNAKDIVHDFVVPPGGKSIGLPQKGRLENGVQLPESPLWVRGMSSKLWGSSHTIATMFEAFRILRNDIGFQSGVLIGAMSHKHGRRFSPHRSHQSGRDIDIRLPLKPGLPVNMNPSADEVDWYATWAIVDAFVRTGEVEAIYLEMNRQERLFTAARVLGVERSKLDEIIRWPTWKGNNAPIVQHSDGHDTHMHVRIRCGPDEPKCKSGL